MNTMINELNNLYEWLEFNLTKEFISAQNHNLVYSYSTFEKLGNELNKQRQINNICYLPNNDLYEYIVDIKNELLLITNSANKNSYQYTTKLLSWYHIVLQRMQDTIMYQKQENK